VNYQFKWSVLWSGQSGAWLLQGLLTTLEISVLAWLLAVLLGVVAGALRTVTFRPLRAVAVFYVEFFRNVPLLVWMFFWYFGVPPLLPAVVRNWLFDHGAEFWAAMFALGVYHGARMSEVIRSGILAIPRTQYEASLAMGLSVFQAYRLIILPIALRLIVPPITNDSLNLLKNSSLALTISVAETTFMTRQIESYTAKGFEAITAGTLIYLVLCLVVSAILSRVERRVAIPGLIVRGGGAAH
jgi:His/Glu/Gln/Arg/opine family amino acid ABC transporter permease subunit